MNQPYFNTPSQNSQLVNPPFGVPAYSKHASWEPGQSILNSNTGEKNPVPGPSNSEVFLNLINSSLKQKKVEKVTRARIVISGNIVQVYEYEKPMVKGVTPGKPKHGGNQMKQKKEEKQAEDVTADSYEIARVRLDNVYRAKTQCKRLINSNAGKGAISDKFVTLTFSDEITDLHEAMYHFKKFHQRLEYRIGKVQYVCVPEIQWKRFNKYGVKVWHFHALFFGLDYLKNSELRKIWGLGFVRINAIDKVDDLGSYVTKYMEKDFSVEEVKNHKRYFASKGLRKPTEFRGKTLSDLPSIPEEYKTFSMSYDNEKFGQVKFTQYRIAEPPSDNKFFPHKEGEKFFSES